jgi:predicted methyltransferase
MSAKSTQELEAQRAVLLRQLQRAGPSIEGSIAMPSRKCGSATCECARGVVKHRAMILCKKVAGRSVATYVPRDLWEQVREWNREHKRLKKVLKEMSAINEQIVRRHVQDKRRAKAAHRSIIVLPRT